MRGPRRGGAAERWDVVAETRLERALAMLAPWWAVAVGLGLLHNAWAALALYHGQALIWSRYRVPLARRGWDWRTAAITVLPCALAGPILWAVLPLAAPGGGASAWLARWGVSPAGLLALLPVFGLLHPLLEEAHWSGLRERHWSAHLIFAGYHMPVLAGLLAPAWLAGCAGALVAASALWTRAQRQTAPGLAVCVAAHAAADLGIVLAAILRTDAFHKTLW